MSNLTNFTENVGKTSIKVIFRSYKTTTMIGIDYEKEELSQTMETTIVKKIY